MPSGVYIRTKSSGMTGKYHSEASKKKMSESRKGKHYSPETELKKGHKINLGRQSRMKGKPLKDNPGISAIHMWIRKYKPSQENCSVCGEHKSLELANIKNHVYTRNLDDYLWLCRKCHTEFDRIGEKSDIYCNSNPLQLKHLLLTETT